MPEYLSLQVLEAYREGRKLANKAVSLASLDALFAL